MRCLVINLTEERRIFMEKIVQHCGKNTKEDLKISEEA